MKGRQLMYAETEKNFDYFRLFLVELKPVTQQRPVLFMLRDTSLHGFHELH